MSIISFHFLKLFGFPEEAHGKIPDRQGVNAPRKRLNLHRQFAEASDDTVLSNYAGGSASYGAIGTQVALHRKPLKKTSNELRL